jgi:ABC-2 type transport system ATP-binding protein
VQDFVREIRTEHDATILLCTHDMAEAEALASRVGIIDRGRLLGLRPAGELKAHYGAASLEEAFLAATGRSLGAAEDESDDEDEDREVLA